MAEKQSSLWENKCVGTGSTYQKYDYPFDEVTSAMQKMIRANKPREACWWAFVLHDSGYYKYVWKRLMVIASEDCGDNMDAAITVKTLFDIYNEVVDAKRRASDKIQPNMFIFQAVEYLCKSEKSRRYDSLANIFSEGLEKGVIDIPEIPEIAKDPHTQSGKQKYGRWNDGTEEEKKDRLRKWVNEWCMSTPRVIEDEYMAELAEMWYDGESRKGGENEV